MAHRIFLIFFLLVFSTVSYAQPIPSPLNIEEEDASPSVFPYKLKVTNTTLTDNGDGTASLNISSSSSGLVDLTDVASATATAGNLLIADGTDWESVTLSNDATMASSGSLTISANAVEESMVNIANSATDEFCLEYESDTNNFSWEACSGGASDLVDLGDVNTATATAGNLLIADGTDWESIILSGDISITSAGVSSVTANSISFSDLSDVNATTATVANLLIADGTDWESITISGDVTVTSAGVTSVTANSIALSDLSDVNATTATAANLLIADGTDWESITMSGDVTVTSAGVTSVTANSIALSDLSDVNATTAVAGNLLIADGTDFESITIGNDVTLAANGSLTISASAVEESMVNIANSATDEFCLEYESDTNNFSWEACSGGASDLVDLGDVNTATATAGNLLIADGTDWESINLVQFPVPNSRGVYLTPVDNSGTITPSVFAFNSLNITNSASATVLTVTADYIVLRDSSDVVFVAKTVSETCTITTSGIGGLEASDSEASDTWYEIYIYAKEDGTVDCLMNDAGGSVGTTPTGYVYSAHVGYVRNNATSNFRNFQTWNIWTYYLDSNVAVLSNGSAATPTDVDCSASAPPKARWAMLETQFVDTDSSNRLRFQYNGAGDNSIAIAVHDSGDNHSSIVIFPLDANRIFEYDTDGASGADADISLNGYALFF